MPPRFRPPRFLIRERAAPRPTQPAQLEITCYHCARPSTHSAHAETGSCPHCARHLRFGDHRIEHEHWGTSVLTTGSVHITPAGAVRANLVVCARDLVIEGTVHAMCLVGGRATIARGAVIHGGIRTASLDLEPGAIIRSCLIETRSRALGTVDLDHAARSAPGKGPLARPDIEPTVRPAAPDPQIAARLIRTRTGLKRAGADHTSARAVS